MQTFVTGAATVLAALIALLGIWVSNRNDRAITKAELELLPNLTPDDAVTLRLIISRRLARWERQSKRSFEFPLLVLTTAIPGAACLALGATLTGRDPLFFFIYPLTRHALGWLFAISGFLLLALVAVGMILRARVRLKDFLALLRSARTECAAKSRKDHQLRTDQPNHSPDGCGDGDNNRAPDSPE